MEDVCPSSKKGRESHLTKAASAQQDEILILVELEAQVAVRGGPQLAQAAERALEVVWGAPGAPQQVSQHCGHSQQYGDNRCYCCRYNDDLCSLC